MQHKVILGLVLVLVIVAGGVFLFNFKKIAGDTETKNLDLLGEMQNTNTPPEETSTVVEALAPSYTVTYTKDGFSPNTIEIPKGATVEYKNESGSQMWVASAIHPTHSLYPQKSPND